MPTLPPILADEQLCLCQTQRADEVSALLGALANQQRLMVVALLLESGEMHVNDIVDQLGGSRTALSRHLARLRELSVVTTRRHHNRIYYTLNHDKAARIVNALGIALDGPAPRATKT